MAGTVFNEKKFEMFFVKLRKAWVAQLITKKKRKKRMQVVFFRLHNSAVA